MTSRHHRERQHQNGGSVKRYPNEDHLGNRTDVRHAKFYEPITPTSHSTDTTIRAVTPDSAGSNGMDLTALPSPTSFPSRNQSQSQHYLQDPQTSMSNTDEEGTIEGRRKKSKRKLKSKRVNGVDTSPNNSFFEKTRKRLGSITTASSTVSRQDDSSLSIGFPSVVQATVFPDLGDMRQQMPDTPRRTVSYDNTTTTTSLSSSIRSPLVLDTDSDKILKLMKTLCGRMHGILFYRPTGTTSWHSGYCAINVASGSLVCQTRGDISSKETLIPDLRGCTVRTHYDSSTQSTHLSVTLPVSGFGYQLRPSVPETFDSWLAALLCWQPLKPKGIYNKVAKPQPISMNDRSSSSARRLSDIATPRSTAVVKSSQLLMWDGPLPAGSFQHQSKRVKLTPYVQRSWRRVNCTLHENGTLRLLSEENASPIRMLKLNSLARCAIQRLDQSILCAKNCIAIHPQYNANAVPGGTMSNPLVLSLGTRVAFEAWFVLLQAMTVPELYGPELDDVASVRPRSRDNSRSASVDMFRIERALQVKVIEAKFSGDSPWQEQSNVNYSINVQKPATRRGTDLYADVLLGQDLRARTVCKPFDASVFWADEFCLTDMPSMVSMISVVFKTGNPDEREWTMTARDEYDTDDERHDFESVEVASHDPVYGRVDIPLLDLEQDSYVEKWWSVLDNNGVQIGQTLIRFNLEGNIVLISSEYHELLKLLHNFDNSLTSQLGQNLSTELKQLSDILLDIFQTSDKAEDWINNLVEEEIDGIYREQPPTMRMRFSGRIHSNDSYESAEQRELLVRDLSRSATMEANLLFRGNSLVTKALDAHMRRIGKDYLERVLADKLRAIVAANPSCEVDPNKVPSSEQLERNWSNLIGHTTSIWQSIAASVSKCPPGIRQVLKHIASCAEDRYGSFIRTVKYTSVSGFLFLRLFCPCILNPKLFGLLEDHPPKQTQRALTLIAKALIVLANLSKFGQKEPWMEPMNKFLTAATPEFKLFIEQICSWNASENTFHEPQYQAALQVKQRLPATSREGLPSLPFLLDAPRSLANLVDLWLDHCPANVKSSKTDTSLKTFHSICLDLRQKVKDCMANAEVAPEPNRNLERQWQRLLHDEPRSRIAMNPFEDMSADSGITALPQPTDRKYSSRHYYTAPSDALEEESDSNTTYPAKTRVMGSTNSSSASLEAFGEYRSRQAMKSRDGDRGRFLEISTQRRPRIESPNADTSQ